MQLYFRCINKAGVIGSSLGIVGHTLYKLVAYRTLLFHVLFIALINNGVPMPPVYSNVGEKH